MRRPPNARALATICLAALALGVVAIAIPVASRAQDAGLYDAPIPADAGFIRVVAADGRAGATVEIDDRMLATGADGVSPYAIFKAGRYPAGGTELAVAAGSFTTLVLGADGRLAVLSDEPLASPKASGIHVYNLSAVPAVTLFAPEFGRTVVEDVASGTTKGRAFGEGALVLEVRAGDRSIATFPKRGINRRQAVSVIVTGTAEAPRAVLVDNTVVRR
ncbi:alginate O-acetyltransferase AlgF [Pseudoxanthobacter sp. M-2]|uniref:alginate O-acetyltransferase AlgF n=1 Tax=Pseudoxanthobacter sp. M-2 TaxID=3078754 RepID=UPI0038FD176C